MNSYRRRLEQRPLSGVDGRCHNAEPGTFGHECGRPAVWIGTKSNGYRSGFCDQCKRRGWEARQYVTWERINEPGQIAEPDLITVYRDDPVWGQYDKWFKVPARDLTRLHVATYEVSIESCDCGEADCRHIPGVEDIRRHAAEVRQMHPGCVLVHL